MYAGKAVCALSSIKLCHLKVVCDLQELETVSGKCGTNGSIKVDLFLFFSSLWLDRGGYSGKSNSIFIVNFMWHVFHSCLVL